MRRGMQQDKLAVEQRIIIIESSASKEGGHKGGGKRCGG
jgi:hypothetical protein